MTTQSVFVYCPKYWNKIKLF